MGHSKWAKTEVKKAAKDGKTSKVFGKLARAITMEAKRVHGDVNSPTLRALIDRARTVDMPKDNIDRAIKRATEPGEAMERITYEAYGPGGVAMIIESITSNRNKAAQEIKHILDLHECALAAIGAASWAFTKSHEGWAPAQTVEITEEDGTKLNALIEELEENDEVDEIYTNAI